MKYKRKLYLSKTESERRREKCAGQDTWVCTYARYLLSRASLAIIRSSLVVKVEKATRFKNSFQSREATTVRSVNYWSESGFVWEFDVFEI